MSSRLRDPRIKSMYAIPSGGQSFKQLSINMFDFRDSLGFLPASLSKIVEDLHLRKHKFSLIRQSLLVRDPITRQFCPDRMAMILKSKGIFPYESMRKWSDFYKLGLPKKEDFFSRLTGHGISDADYAQAQEAFTLFRCRNMLDYTKIYCLSGK